MGGYDTCDMFIERKINRRRESSNVVFTEGFGREEGKQRAVRAKVVVLVMLVLVVLVVFVLVLLRWCWCWC